MKILSLHVAQFGKLQNFDLQFNSGLNVMQRQNGFGKTTLASFIRAMLYGFSYTRTKRGNESISDAAVWKTWNSTGKIGGSMVVEHNVETYRIERYFGTTAKEETFAFTNEKTGKAVAVQSAGEFLLGLTAESYDRCAYLPQEAVKITSNDNFDTRLAGLVQNAENYDKVQEDLRRYRKNLRYEKGNGGEIWQAEEERARLQRELDQCQAQLRRRQDIDARLAEIDRERQAMKIQSANVRSQIDALQRQVAQTQFTDDQLAARNKLQQLRERLDRYSDFEQDKAACDSLAEKISRTPDAAKPQRKPAYLLLVLGVLLAVIGIVLGFAVSAFCYAAAVVGVVVAAVSFFVKPAVKTMQAGEKDALVTQYYRIAEKYVYCADKDYNQVQKEMWQQYSVYTGDKREYQALRQTVGTFGVGSEQAEADLQKQQNEQAEIYRRQEQLSLEEGRLAEERSRLNTDVLPLNEKIWVTDNKIAQLKHRYQVAEKVSLLLLQAKETLSTGYLPSLCQRCSQLLCQVTGGKYEAVLDRNFTMQLRQEGVTKPLDGFSRGIREITLLCFRIALAEMLFDGNVPLLIIDDAFVNFDEENFLRATQLVNDLSQKTQVVYFTCHNRLGQLR